MRTNVVELEVLNNRFAGIVTEMGRNIWRSSFTPFVKDAWDFGMALVSPSGEVFGYSKEIGVAFMVAAPFDHAIQAVDDLEPGDVVISNDPYIRSGGMASHLPDINLIKPFFYDGEIVCYLWTFIHSSDIGGLAPGSIAPTAVDIYQEGLRIPPLKLYRKGVLNDDVMALLLANSRIPLPNRGDLNALTAAMNTAERRLIDTMEHYGLATVQRAIVDLLDYAETFSRSVIEGMPDGTYTFHDYLELDVIGAQPARICVSATVSGSELMLDYAGTDPQVQAAYNVTTFGRNNHWLTGVLAGFFLSLSPQAPLNKGLWRPLSVVIPEGTILTPEPPAAVGVRGATAIRASEVLLGALSQACDGRVLAPAVSGVIPAGGCGIAGVAVMSVFDEETGERVVNTVTQLRGGSGARPTKDGVDGADVLTAYSRSIPVEVFESEMPAVVRHYRLATPPAAGRWRGGLATDICVEATAPNSILTARGLERCVFRPWARAGGKPGRLTEVVLDAGTDREHRISKIDVLRMQPGDTVRIVTSGGAGFGDPMERDPARVLTDVMEEYVTPEEAKDVYGVVLGDGATVDAQATTELRQLPRPDSGPFDFGFGPERETFERRFPTRLHDQFLAALQHRIRPEQRHYYLTKAHDLIIASTTTPEIDDLLELLPAPREVRTPEVGTE